MKNKFVTVALLFFTYPLFAQQMHPVIIAVDTSKQIVISTNDISVDYEGYDGQVIEVSSVKDSIREPALARGLRQIPSGRKMGPDSISYSLSKENADQLRVRLSTRAGHLCVKVPKSIWMLSIQAYSLRPGSVLKVKNISKQLDIHAAMKSIELNDLDGPFAVQTEFGDVSLKGVRWNPRAEWMLSPRPPQLDYPYIIRSKTSDIRIFAYAGMQASFHLKADQGKIFSDLVLSKDQELNGGGSKIFAETLKGNVYLLKDTNTQK